MSPWSWLFRAALLFTGAVLVRSLPAAQVLWQGEVFFRGPDSYYHMRRIAYTIRNFPEILVFDPYIQFPHGARPIWSPLFDWLSAALLIPIADSSDWLRVEQAAAWIPPILGGLTAVATWTAARRVVSESAALGAGALLCILGGHFNYSQVGALDHHVAVSLATTILLGSMFSALRSDSRRRILRSALAVGAWVALSLLIWPGSLLYSVMALGGLAGFALAADDGAVAAIRWRGLAIASGFSALIVAPFCFGNEWLHHNSMSPEVLSDFQPWLLGTIAAIGLGGGLVSERPSLATRAFTRAGAVAGLGIALFGAGLLFSTELAESLGGAWRWLSKSEDFQSNVIESQGLFVVNGKISAFMAHIQLSYLLYGFPLFWTLILVDGWRGERRAPVLFLLGWSATLFGFTLLQKRFLDTFTVAFAIVAAAGIQLLWNRMRLTSHASMGRVAFLGIVVLLAPLARNYLPHIQNIAQRLSGEPVMLHPWAAARVKVFEAAQWIRASTPHTQGWYDASRQPEYAVLAPWSVGHQLKYIARRPTIVDNFGDDVGAENYEIERRFWASPVPGAAQTAKDLGARYVVVVSTSIPRVPYLFATIFDRLSRHDGSAIELPDGETLPAASRFRLVFESGNLGRAKSPFIKVFEIVEGARIRGHTRPGAIIDLSLPVTTNRARQFEYRDRAVAGEDGWFEFVVPYPNRDGPNWLYVSPVYTLTCDGGQTEASVPEGRVAQGSVIPVSDPCRN